MSNADFRLSGKKKGPALSQKNPIRLGFVQKSPRINACLDLFKAALRVFLFFVFFLFTSLF